MSSNDQQIIRECLQGNPEAFGLLVRLYHDRLYNTVYRLLAQAEDAQDVVQETFLQAYQSLGSFKGDSLFYTWLYRIAVNTAISWKRKKKFVLSMDQLRSQQLSPDPADVSREADPAFFMDRAEEDAALYEALNALSAEHRTVLVLKEIEGMKYEEMADVLQVAVGTIRSRLHRARAELRVLLEAKPKPTPERE